MRNILKLIRNLWMEIFFVYYHHAMYAFQSEFKLFSCLNFKEFFTWGRRDIWRLSDSIRIRAHIDLVHKRALNNLAKDVGSNPIAVTGNFVVKTKPGSFNAVSANMKLEQTIQIEKKEGKRYCWSDEKSFTCYGMGIVIPQNFGNC